MSRLLRALLPAWLVLLVSGSVTPPDDLDSFISAQMAQRHLSGLSIAIIEGGRIVDVRAYGVTDSAGGRMVDTTTLFQAGSISKSVAAMNTLHLVEQKKLELDNDINATLRTWKLPASEFTATKPVTLRQLLSHSGGTTVHGFPGYAVTDRMPTLVQVLDGAPPANTPAIRSDFAPGMRYNYSGGGYTIMQQMVLDVTGKKYPDVMRENVLAPLGMARSTYEQPLPPALATKTAAGHYNNGTQVVGRVHVYPEMAAAGLWTTPSDLARFAIEVQRAYAGKSSAVISQSMAKEMLTVQKGSYALGLIVSDTGMATKFAHNGRDEGFDADMIATLHTGQGVVIMINANEDSRLVARIRAFVMKKYHWPNAPADYPAPQRGSVTAAEVNSIAGRYDIGGQMVAFTTDADGRLYTSIGGHPDEEFIPVTANRIVSAERPTVFSITRDSSGAVSSLALGLRSVPRIGPLFASVVPGPPDAARDARVDAVLRAIADGGATLASVAGITEGVRKDFAAGWLEARNLRSPKIVALFSVAGRNIQRHGSAVASVAYYHVNGQAGAMKMLVYYTADGLITDFDTVDE